MSTKETLQKLADINDEGFFEQLATAILREANPNYHSLVHTGVNLAGKTIKSPLDGVCFVQGDDPLHIITVHHTIAIRNDLKKKWLHDPSRVKTRKGSRPTAPAGDLIKTAELIAKERTRTPNLRATLVLTTNDEPSEDLVREVNEEGHTRGLEIDIWSRSRLSHFLDNSPTGQWLRYKFLHIEQEQLSFELFRDLSRKSLNIYKPPDNPSAWVPRNIDVKLTTTNLHRDVTFLVAESGLGKSVACYQALIKHLNDGGLGIVLPHEVIASTMTLEQAVMATLHQLHPSLANVNASALAFCSPERPLLLVVEDINRSGQSQLLVEKIARWSRISVKDNKEELSYWRLICPVWPKIINSLEEQTRKRIESLTIMSRGFTKSEACDAVLARACLDKRKLSSLRAEEIASALGHDPLLIALHDQEKFPEPNHILHQFVENSLSRVANEKNESPTTDYRQAIRALAREMLTKRQIEVSWKQIKVWKWLQEYLHLISHLASHGDLIRLTGLSDDQRLSFRHDRVRNWILADAASDLEHQGLLPEDVVADPYFAEIVGTVLVWEKFKSDFLQRVAIGNPLALFHALRILGHTNTPHHETILKAINDWLDDPVTHNISNLHLRMEALAILAETDFAEVPALVKKFHDRTPMAFLSRLRNGDVVGGIELCIHMSPGSGAPWRDIQIEHAKLCYGHKLTETLDEVLRRSDLDSAFRIGALRLAGHVADTHLALAIEVCWTVDEERSSHLAEYLWAFGECCGDDPEHYLEPVCEAWASLSDQPDKAVGISARSEVAAYEIRWAFQKWPPLAALDYFIQRGSQDDLRWPITYMLHGIDHPNAVLFVVQELAAIQKQMEGTNSFSPFAMMAKDDWQRKQEDKNCPMSKESRDLLLGLWQNEKNDKYLRNQALSFWATTQNFGDIEVLRAVNPADKLADNILGVRLTRGDQSAISAMIKKLATDNQGYWWQFGRHLWSPELTIALDNFLDQRGVQSKRFWGECFGSDWITYELIMRLPENQAEHILLKHWEHLRYSSYFVQTALYVSTRRLVDAVQIAIRECPEPSKLLEHLSFSFGIRTKGHPGITREAQILALTPYLDLLSPMDIGAVWETCNEHGWFTMRQNLLDNRLQPPFLKWKWDHDQAMLELDKMISDKHMIRVVYWVDDFLKTGISWTEIFATMIEWLDKWRTLEALKVVIEAVKQRGTRKDLSALQIYGDISQIIARQLIIDTEFEVRRRSIR